MKAVFIIISLLTLSAFSQEKLMELTRSSGFVPPEMAFHSKCEIYGDWSMLRNTKGATGEVETKYNQTIYTNKLQDVNQVLAALTEASEGGIIKFPAPMDGPSSVYIGILEGEVFDKYIKIYSISGGGFGSKNNSPAVKDLMEFANVNCVFNPKPLDDSSDEIIVK